MAVLPGGELLIGEHNWSRYAAQTPNGQCKGLIPRDYTTHPRGFYSTIEAVDFPTIPRSEWSVRLSDMITRKARLSDIKRAARVPILDQNGRGYCWMHSGVACVQTARAVMNQPTIGLSAYSSACKIKNFRDQGGWGAQGMDFLVQYGVCDENTWPQQATQRTLDTPAAWENAKKYRVTAQLADMQTAQYNRNMAWEQYATLWLTGNPTVNDYNWWGHSVEGVDLVEGQSLFNLCRDEDSGKLLTLEEFELAWGMDDEVTAGFGCRIANSWGEGWSEGGYGVLAANKAVPDGGVGLLVVTAS